MKSLLMTLAFTLFAGTAYADGHAKVYFINLSDGDTVEAPVFVQFGLHGMGVAPAGVDAPNTGHHHLFINRAPLGAGEFGEDELALPIPGDDNHKHFGKGQTEASLDLPAGEHTLQMVFGDLNHVPLGMGLASDVITITVK